MCRAQVCDTDTKQVRYVTWFEGENTSCKAEFIWYNTAVQEMSISI